MEEYKQWLEQQIERCLNDKDLQREHWAFCKAYEKFTALRQPHVSGSLRPLTVQRVDKMLKDISLQTFIACGGNKTEWKEWWSKRNNVNVNSNNC